MIVDAHVHIFPPEIIKNRKKYEKKDQAFEWLYADSRARLADAGELITAMDQDDIDLAVVCGFPWQDEGICRLHNDYLLESAKQWNQRLLALAAVDPLEPWARQEAERAFSKGCCGLGEIGVYHQDLGEPEALIGISNLAGLCAETGKPLLLHTNEPVGHRYPGKSPMSIKGLYELVRLCPHTRFQLAHLGGGIFFFELLKKETQQVLSNCVFDTAAAPFLYQPALYNIYIALCGPTRLLFGSDFPLLKLKRYLKDMQLAQITSEHQQLLLGRNAQKFWSRTN